MKKKIPYLSENEAPLTPLTAIEEASRCLLCKDAPCSQGCPAKTDPAKFLRSIRFRNLKGAAETIRENNILGGICARVCPYDELCEKACSRSGIDRPIRIGKLQRFVTDFEHSIGMKVLDPVPPTGEKVAVIGSGPAGLAAAASLALKGYFVTIFEAESKAGGWLTYGIPPARLPQKVVEDEIQYVQDLGVEFVFDCKIPRDLSLDDLRAKGYAAFILAVGMHEALSLDIPGCHSAGVISAVAFLSAAKPNEGRIEVGNQVVVIGGGDVAIDCATTAKLLGAESVSIVYRRALGEMPANKSEIKYAQSLGVNFFPCFKPLEIIEKEGKAVGLRAVGLHWPDRNTSVEVPENALQLRVDRVILAIGQKADDLREFAPLDWNGKRLAEKTDLPDVFAAGDITNGGRTVVEAVASGKSAAESVENYLNSLKKAGVK